MRTLIACIVSIVLAGCTTCREHPVSCGVGAALIIGAAAASNIHGHHSVGPPDQQIGAPGCSGGVCQ